MPSPDRPAAASSPALAQRPGTDPRHLAIALHHAQQIQAQKDTQTLILDRILELIELPSSPTADPATPAAADVAALKSALRPFQPADYDNLILERNIEGRCGYALCPREHRKEDPRVRFRIVWGAKGSGAGGRGREMDIVPREKLEMWCSSECAERAMYIRVQLAEEPVWERRADDRRGRQILLLEEGRAASNDHHRQRQPSASVKDVLGQLDNLNLATGSASDSADLALERGDVHPALHGGRVEVQIREKQVAAGSTRAPELRPEDRMGGAIEGYVPRDTQDQDQDMLDLL
ncbi:hypothetical protein ASPZODRAFT_132755 [Penicilliopsis zonata CBS 506.65]|uniref:RNA polymerase II subunit B1 CTD phosphatase RPAP2 homolog n=1 Tax=Penicilliopsis zonata CBS 506.65 TaxID=1073090 RepID=A0A1L9SHP7_9EURO|nr:hypothetical protein ASPZODRAFT_132755 [Penicilliopsis zonata CBS 506.65]OJJ46657.1 hypothetical protein ASPZODRAFT_132755 [Penicilliopsis zonata CBS 506.65]